MVNFSDICAMNGTPTQLLITIGVSKRFALEQIEEIYAGIYMACEQYNVDVVGGDTTSSLTGLTLSITCLGEADENKIVIAAVPKSTIWCVSQAILALLTWDYSY